MLNGVVVSCRNSLSAFQGPGQLVDLITVSLIAYRALGLIGHNAIRYFVVNYPTYGSVSSQLQFLGRLDGNFGLKRMRSRRRHAAP
jgi:hypothetical protein